MGSTKHIRNNGEHLNIHGHDNYQMPGAYKQMGDKNQNQSLGAYKSVGDQEMMQPSKISGGAAKYIKQSYAAGKIGDPPVEDKTAKQIDLKEPKVPSGSVTSYTKDNIKDVIKSQQEYDKNTTQVSQNLAEIDSLKKVASGQAGGARSLYGRKYNSSMPLDGVNIGSGTNSGYGGGLDYSQNMNIRKLREEAKTIQGPRPSLGANKIHSSKGYGINKILGDLDNSGDLSGYEAKRQAAIEENMSTGSTKKRYKH